MSPKKGFPYGLLYNSNMRKLLDNAEVTTVAFKWSKKHWDYLRLLTHKASVEKGKNLTASDLIRSALEKSYPLPK